MTVRRFILALALAVVVAAHPAAATADAPVAAPGIDVTRTAVIQRDLAVAEARWQEPAACAALSVTVRDVPAANGNGGVLVAHPAASAELGGCAIRLTPHTWREAFAPEAQEFTWSAITPDGTRMSLGQMQRAYGCGVIEHEYGHLLGMPDVAGSGLMDGSQWLLTPECERAYTPATPPRKPARHHRR